MLILLKYFFCLIKFANNPSSLAKGLGSTSLASVDANNHDNCVKRSFYIKYHMTNKFSIFNKKLCSVSDSTINISAMKCHIFQGLINHFNIS